MNAPADLLYSKKGRFGFARLPREEELRGRKRKRRRELRAYKRLASKKGKKLAEDQGAAMSKKELCKGISRG